MCGLPIPLSVSQLKNWENTLRCALIQNTSDFMLHYRNKTDSECPSLYILKCFNTWVGTDKAKINIFFEAMFIVNR
jgi:hypothetical protein